MFISQKVERVRNPGWGHLALLHGVFLNDFESVFLNDLVLDVNDITLQLVKSQRRYILMLVSKRRSAFVFHFHILALINLGRYRIGHVLLT